MASFLSGITSGYSNTASKNKKGLIQRIKARRQSRPSSAPAAPVTGGTDTEGGYVPDFKRGGKVRGRKGRKVLATLEPGERVLTKRQARKYRGGRKRR